jgi:hypothetical protein
VSTGIKPKDLWEMDPMDLATIVDVLEEQNRKRR